MQPLRPFGLEGTTYNQMQLTLPEGAPLLRGDQTDVRVQLDQLAPASLPALPAGLKPQGNGNRVRLSYVPSGSDQAARCPSHSWVESAGAYSAWHQAWRADFLALDPGRGRTPFRSRRCSRGAPHAAPTPDRTAVARAP